MTKYECAIVMAFTGTSMLQGSDIDIFYQYIEEKLGRPVMTHELAAEETWYKIKQASKDDFLKLCMEAVG